MRTTNGKNGPYSQSDIYQRAAVIKYGLPDCWQADDGKESMLIRFFAFLTEPLRSTRRREPFRKVSSVHNTVVERKWGTINQNVSANILHILDSMVDAGLIKPKEDPIDEFCVSECLVWLLSHRLSVWRGADSWHRVPGARGCVPQIAASRHSGIKHLDPDQLPDTEELVEAYEAAGGRLKRQFDRGFDPLGDREDLQLQRQKVLLTQVGSIPNINRAVNLGNGMKLVEMIMVFITATKALAQVHDLPLELEDLDEE